MPYCRRRKKDWTQTTLCLFCQLCLVTVCLSPFKIKVATGNDKSTTLFSKTKQYCLLVSVKQIFCPNEKTFTKLGTILQERRSFSNSFQSVWRDDIFPTNIKLDLTQESASKMVHWGKVLFFNLIESGRLVQLQH